MPSYKLTYFNGRGRAETMRWMFAYAGQQYEDNRVTDQWKELKPKTPFGQMPLLEVDGKVVCQSHACERYLAKTFGIYGSNDWEGAEIDMVIDYLEDLIKPFVKFIFEKDETKKAELKKKYEEEELPVFLKNLEKLLVKAGGQYFVGNKLSYADIGFACVMGVYLDNGKIAYDKSAYPKLVALKERVENEPKIKAWIEKRPQSSF